MASRTADTYDNTHEGEHVDLDEDAPGQPISLPESADTGEGGKLRMIVQLVKKAFGVKDIAAMRLSLPASLLEPIPNLEYWQYIDRPDLFAAVNDSDDPFERMLAVLRFTFSKELKFVHGKVCKPYNSVLGEHFRSHWDVIPVSYPSNDPTLSPIQHLYLASPHAQSEPDFDHLSSATGSGKRGSVTVPGTPVIAHAGTYVRQKGETASVKSGKSAGSRLSLISRGTTATGTSTPGGKTGSTPGTTPDLSVDIGSLDAAISSLDLASPSSPATPLLEASEPTSPASPTSSSPHQQQRERVRVAFLTEQISHHPPVSAFYVTCPARHVSLSGIDQISARVSGTSVRVTPGSLNKGLFLSLTEGAGARAGEQYHITHPVASVNGLLRGSFYATIGEACFVTCSGGEDSASGVGEKGEDRLRAIIEYKEESWLGKAQFLVEGVIHSYTPSDSYAPHTEWTRIKHVPRSRVVAQLVGTWRGEIRWKRPSEPESAWRTLVDLSRLRVVPKVVRDLDRQEERESRKLWESVTEHLKRKEYSEATKCKVAIEQRQREEAAERKRKGVKFVPQFFEPDISSGIPVLTAKGREALEDVFQEPSTYPLEGQAQEQAVQETTEDM